MGNRAVIAFGPAQDALGVYLHWNGGEESVKAFLDATRELMRSRGPDRDYGPARLVQVIGNFFGGTTSLGLNKVSELDTDNGDNGTFVVDPESLEIVERRFNRARPFDQGFYHGVLFETLAKNREIFAQD